MQASSATVAAIDRNRHGRSVTGRYLRLLAKPNPGCYRSFQQHLAEFDQPGIKIAAISADPVETNQRHTRKMGYTFSFLSDPDAAVIRRYDVLHAKAGPKEADIARPAEFLVDPSGNVRWRDLTESAAVRTRPQRVLKTFDEQYGKTDR